MEQEQTVTDILGTTHTSVTTGRTFIGRARTFAGLNNVEWSFLVISTVNILICTGLTVYRLVKVIQTDPKSPDFSFVIVILINAAFCGFYIIHGLLREKEFEIYAYIGAIGVILCYCIVEYIVNDEHRTNIKLARLIIGSVLGPLNIILAVVIARQFGWLEFKIVGASEELQYIYREASRYTSLLKFDLQLSVTFMILVLQVGSHVTGFPIILLAVGLPVMFALAIVAWVSLRMEYKVGVLIFTILGLIQPVFVIYKLVTVYSHKHNDAVMTLIISIIITGVLCLLIHILVYYELYRTTKNFGKGLKERAFSVDERTSLLAVARRR